MRYNICVELDMYIFISGEIRKSTKVGDPEDEELKKNKLLY